MGCDYKRSTCLFTFICPSNCVQYFFIMAFDILLLQCQNKIATLGFWIVAVIFKIKATKQLLNWDFASGKIEFSESWLLCIFSQYSIFYHLLRNTTDMHISKDGMKLESKLGNSWISVDAAFSRLFTEDQSWGDWLSVLAVYYKSNKLVTTKGFYFEFNWNGNKRLILMRLKCISQL